MWRPPISKQCNKIQKWMILIEIDSTVLTTCSKLCTIEVHGQFWIEYCHPLDCSKIYFLISLISTKLILSNYSSCRYYHHHPFISFIRASSAQFQDVDSARAKMALQEETMEEYEIEVKKEIDGLKGKCKAQEETIRQLNAKLQNQVIL